MASTIDSPQQAGGGWKDDHDAQQQHFVVIKVPPSSNPWSSRSVLLGLCAVFAMREVFRGWEERNCAMVPPPSLRKVHKNETNAPAAVDAETQQAGKSAAINNTAPSSSTPIPSSWMENTTTLASAATAAATSDRNSSSSSVSSNSNSSNNNNSHPPTTPSGWFPTDEWLERCAADQESKAKQQQTQQHPDDDDQPPEKFAIESGWEGYRLGDCIKLCEWCRGKRFVGSLASLYEERACLSEDGAKSLSNATVIDQILRMRDGTAGFVRPGDDEIVVHLRLGDVVENSRDNVTTMLVRGGRAQHSTFSNKRSIKSAYELLDNVQESGAAKVILIGGSHHKIATTKSRPYSECLRKTFERAGYDVSLEVNNANPDQDFYRMSHAKYIVVSTGGFSRLVGQNAARHGGTIIGKVF